MENESVFDLLAKQVLDELGDASLNLAAISGWMKNSLASLNIKLYNSLTEETLPLDQRACAVLKQLYVVRYYQKMISLILQGIISPDGAASILSLKDGSSSVTFQNKNEVAKSFKSLLDLEKKDLSDLIRNYQIWRAKPQAVGEADFFCYEYAFAPVPNPRDQVNT